MKNKTTCFAVLFSMLVILIGVIVAIAARISFTSVGIENISNVDALKKMDIKIEFAWGMNGGEESFCKHLQDDGAIYLDAVSHAAKVLIVEPTGNIEQFCGSLSQEVQVVTILDEINSTLSPGAIIHIFSYQGFKAVDNSIVYTNTNNIMYPGNQYLVAVEESELNAYGMRDFYFDISIFSCICLNRFEEQTVCKTLDFNAVPNISHFCTSEKMLNAIQYVDQLIIKKYDLDV